MNISALLKYINYDTQMQLENNRMFFQTNWGAVHLKGHFKTLETETGAC